MARPKSQKHDASPKDFCPKCRTHRPPGACELVIQKILNVYTDSRMHVPPDTPRPGAYLFQEQLSHLGSLRDADAQGWVKTKHSRRRPGAALLSHPSP